MACLKSSRQRFIGAIAIAALLLSLALAACGTPANAANNTASPSSGNTVQQTQQIQRSRSSHSNSSSSSAGLRSTDQQVQSLLRQLDGAQSDVNNADSGASQDSGQP